MQQFWKLAALTAAVAALATPAVAAGAGDLSTAQRIARQERGRHADPRLFNGFASLPAQARGGFDWADAGIGLAGGVGLAVFAGGGALLVLRVRNGRLSHA